MADDKAAFGVFPQMKAKRSKQDREAAKNVPIDLARGALSGVLGAPGDIESLIRMLPGLSEETILPTSEDIEKRLPFRSETPVSQAATGLGQLGGGFYTGRGSPLRAIAAVPSAVKRAAKEFAEASAAGAPHLTVWHGSPHKFAPTPKNPLGEFDPKKIGTGEGNQSFGYGHYTAEAPGVATDYKRKLSNTLNVDGDATPLEKRAAEMALTFGDNTSDGAIKWLEKHESKGTGHTVPALTPELIQSVKQKFSEGVFSPAGHLYKIDLADEAIPKMLDWDKPLSQQPEVIKALKGTDYEIGLSQKEAEKIADQRLREEAYEWADNTGGDPVDYINNADWEKYVDDVRKESGNIDSNITGAQLHKIIMKDSGYRPELFDPHDYQIDTSETLKELGIPGIKYLDQASRNAGEGTSNFVVFPGNEDLLTILERKKEGGIVMSDNPDTMMLELQEKRMAGGGALSKGLKAVVNATKEAPMIVVPSNISNVKEAVRQSKGDYGARRVERAADEIPNLEKLYKEEALRQAFSGENNKAVVTMNPADFEKYAHSLAGRTRSDIGPKMAKLAEQGEIDKYTVPTEEYIQHLMRLQGGFDDIPYLNLYKNEVGIPSMPEIRGHEGRHRSRALAKQGENTSLVRISPRGDLYEGLPRRSQEEYIEALREELERSGRLVLPEIEDSSRRPAVKFPEPYAEGGKVNISDNPDAMMMDVGDREFAGGGIIKRLARAPAKSKQEIEAIAERIAPQVTGEFVRKPKETQSVAGKTQKQFAREKELPVEFADVKPVPKVEVLDPESLKGMVVTGIPGDPTVTGKSLVRVGETKLDSPSPQHGGPLYGLGRDDDIFWASGIEPAGRVQSVAKEAMQAYDAPVAGQYIMMGPDSINYAMHFADANLSAIDPSKMTKRQIEEFNKLIRFGDEKSGARPSFPGIENKEDAYLHFAFDPHLRKHFNKLMQMPTVTETFNLPSGQDIRFAITEAPLRDLETGVTGFSMGRLAPDVPKSALPLSEHPTYSHDIPGQFMGGLKYPTPYELSFPDTLKSVRENPKQAGQEFGSLKMVGPRQIYDQQMIDELKMYEEAMKRLTGKKEGGEVQKAGGGLLKKAALIDGNDFVLAAQKYGLSDDIQTLNKLVALVNKGSSVDQAARTLSEGMKKTDDTNVQTQAHGGLIRVKNKRKAKA